MKPFELREQAARWRARAPQYDPWTQQALFDAAESFEALAERDEVRADARDSATPFLHRAYQAN
jgi:hypothetical protein